VVEDITVVGNDWQVKGPLDDNYQRKRKISVQLARILTPHQFLCMDCRGQCSEKRCRLILAQQHHTKQYPRTYKVQSASQLRCSRLLYCPGHWTVLKPHLANCNNSTSRNPTMTTRTFFDTHYDKYKKLNTLSRVSHDPTLSYGIKIEISNVSLALICSHFLGF
jgi:hypothetical protein